jgi:F0F1-type ATP synthase membrane subunit b/b'
VRTDEATRERDELERLHHDEIALERELAAARRDAAALVETARREAEAIVAEARRALEEEVAALRAAAAAELEGEREAARASTDAAIAELARRAERNRSWAVARALAVVLEPAARPDGGADGGAGRPFAPAT